VNRSAFPVLFSTPDPEALADRVQPHYPLQTPIRCERLHSGRNDGETLSIIPAPEGARDGLLLRSASGRPLDDRGMSDDHVRAAACLLARTRAWKPRLRE
jgi:hypothetical protein